MFYFPVKRADCSGSTCYCTSIAVDPFDRKTLVRQNIQFCSDNVLFFVKRVLKTDRLQAAMPVNLQCTSAAVDPLGRKLWLVKNLILLCQCSFFPMKVYSKLCEGSVIPTVIMKIEFRSENFVLIIFCSPVLYNE